MKATTKSNVTREKVFIQMTHEFFQKTDDYSKHLQSIVTATEYSPSQIAYLDPATTIVWIPDNNGNYMLLDSIDYTIIDDQAMIALLNNESKYFTQLCDSIILRDKLNCRIKNLLKQQKLDTIFTAIAYIAVIIEAILLYITW